MSENIPIGWTKTILARVADWGSGGTPPREQPEYFGGTIPWIKTGELGAKYITEAEESITEKAIENSSAKIFPKGSVGIAMYGATIGKTSIWGIDAATNQACAVAVPKANLIDTVFLYYFLLSQKQAFINRGKGGAQRNISLTLLKNWPIPLPPLSEQRRIVAKIEELFSQLDAGAATLEQARAQLKRYRQALLKAAFEGRLTADWRRAHAGELEPADALLARIRAAREARWRAQLAAWEEAVRAWEAAGKPGKKPRKPRKPKELPPLTEEERAELPKLPEGWAWNPFGNIVIEAVLGKMLDKKKNKGQMKPYLRNINVRWGRFDLQDIQLMRIEDDELERYRLEKGDLVICEGGEPGRCAVWNDEMRNMSFQKALHRIRLPYEYVLPRYAFYFIYFAAQTGLLEKYFTGTTIKHLTGVGLSKVPFPITSSREQQLVISYLDQHLSTIDYLDQTIEQALARAAALRQAILKRAFAGELVPQDPEDEPAGELLARLRAGYTTS